MLYLNGYTIGQFQRCKRPHAIARTHRLSKWRPQSLLGACLRMAIFSLSNGFEIEKVTSDAVNYFLSNARNPGLDVTGIDTYTLASDYCSIIRNVLEYLSRLTLLPLHEVSPISLSSTIYWQFLSHMDETGSLHRWKFVDYIEEDFTPELHSWEVFGDIAAADVPMTLHLVAIGQRRAQHQHSAWCKVYAHPNLANVYQFQRRDGGKLQGEWKAVWFSGNSQNNSKDWVDMMLRDNAVEGLIKHISIKEVSKEHQDLFEKDALIEGELMEQIHKAKMDPRDLSMSRYACDHPYTCPHQLYCYTNAKLENAGIYESKVKEDKDALSPINV